MTQNDKNIVPSGKYCFLAMFLEAITIRQTEQGFPKIYACKLGHSASFYPSFPKLGKPIARIHIRDGKLALDEKLVSS